MMLFDLDVGGIVDSGLRVTLAGLAIFGTVCCCSCKDSPPSLYLAGSNLKVSNFTWSSLDILPCAVVGWSSSLPSNSGGPCDLVLGLLIFTAMLHMYFYTIVLLSLTFVKLHSLCYLAIQQFLTVPFFTKKILTLVYLNFSYTCILFYYPALQLIMTCCI